MLLVVQPCSYPLHHKTDNIALFIQGYIPCSKLHNTICLPNDYARSRNPKVCSSSKNLSLGVLHIWQINWALVDIQRPHSWSWAGVSPIMKRTDISTLNRGELQPNMAAWNMSPANFCASIISSATPAQNWAWNLDLKADTYLDDHPAVDVLSGTNYLPNLFRCKQTVQTVLDVCQNVPSAGLTGYVAIIYPSWTWMVQVVFTLPHQPQFHCQILWWVQ